MRTIINTTKDVLDKAKWFAYHKEQNNTARKYLKSIEDFKGKLDAKNIKLCSEYAKDVFGHDKYTQWLIVYCTYSREFKEGWIPDNYYGEVVLPQLNAEYGKISNRNPVINKLFDQTDSLDLCYYTNLLFFNTAFEILNEKNIKKILFKQNETVVFKLENSRQGKGIFLLDEKSFDISFIKKLGNGVFQKHIKQHDFFTQFKSPSVATIRITSFINNEGNPQAIAGFFKFGAKSDKYIKSTTAMYIPYDIKTGILSDEAYSYNWEVHKQIPNDDLAFAGQQLPLYKDCLAKVKEAHSRIPFIRCTGWDLAVSNNNEVKIIEVNGGHNGITLNETTQGPCYKGLGWEDLRKTI
jgi:hypothetical protein